MFPFVSLRWKVIICIKANVFTSDQCKQGGKWSRQQQWNLNPHLDDCLQLIRSDTGMGLQKQSLLQGDAGLLVSLKRHLQGPECQTSTNQVDKNHDEHSEHRLPLHHRVQGCCGGGVPVGVHTCHHTGRAGGNGQTGQRTVTVGLWIAAHWVLHGGDAGLDQTGLHHARLDLFGRDQVGLNSHWGRSEVKGIWG